MELKLKADDDAIESNVLRLDVRSTQANVPP